MYTIVDVDFWENYAILVIDDKRFWFQWSADNHPTLEDAIKSFEADLREGMWPDSTIALKLLKEKGLYEFKSDNY